MFWVSELVGDFLDIRKWKFFPLVYTNKSDPAEAAARQVEVKSAKL